MLPPNIIATPDVILSCFPDNHHAHWLPYADTTATEFEPAMLSRLRRKPIQTGPAYAKKSLLADEPHAFYLRLRRALPNCVILPDMALSAFLAPTATDARQLRQQQEQLAGRKVAYAIFDAAIELLCVIELTRAGASEEERALTLEFLQGAGIKHFSWDAERLPSMEQILRAMVAYTGIEPPKFEPAANSILRPEPREIAPRAPVPQPQRRISTSSLTLEELQALTPQGHVKATYPHIWERICLFCTEPRHLEQYLSSLSLQDRGGKRAGFPEGVIAELAELQGANARFIPTQTQIRAGWNDVFFNR